jgi:hypothetical protein
MKQLPGAFCARELSLITTHTANLKASIVAESFSISICVWTLLAFYLYFSEPNRGNGV